MAADRELVDDIFRDSDEEEFVRISREELGIHSDVEVEKYEEDNNDKDETGREIHDEIFCASCQPVMDKNLYSNKYSTLFSGESWAYKYPQ